MKRILFYFIIIAALLNFQTQISEKFLTNELINNVTSATVYDKEYAYLKLNNNSFSQHYITLSNDTDLISLLTERDIDVLYKKNYMKSENILNILLVFGFASVIFMKGSIMGRGAIFSEKKVNVTLTDVAGLESNKQEVFEFVDFLKHRKKYMDAGAKMPRGALFYGPPGTGKTLMAKAIAGECNISFLQVAGSDFSEMFVGVGAARIRDLFKKAREKSPCIVFIDEIDALAKSRSHLSHHEKDNTLNRLLVELDGFNENDNVLIIAATNRLDMLDKALLRPGRFDRKIPFDLPEKREREKIFEHYLQKNDCSEHAQHLSEISFGFSCADIANVCNEACILSVRKGLSSINLELIEEAIDNVMLGPKKTTFELCKREKRTVAFHEAGHAVAAFFLDHAFPPVKVSIMPRGKSALGFSQSQTPDTKLMTREEILDKIGVLFGGRISEELFCDTITTGASDDIEKATKLADKYVTVFGMDYSISIFHYDHKMTYSEALNSMKDKSIRTILSNCYEKTKTLLKGKKDKIEKLANLLLEKETLDKETLDEFFK